MPMFRLCEKSFVFGVLKRILLSFLCVSVAGVFPVGSAGAEDGAPQWSEEDRALTSLEDLIYMNVTSVSKRDQKLSESAAAIFVITQEDIQRMGAVSIPEALRIVPGMQVSQLDGGNYAITSRGFNSLFADKLLVLIDGRSVYTPVFAGVFWAVQDTMMEDIERIEVIRGPGATLWGANAVNGVINIITKKAEDTQGGLVSAGAGTQEKAFTSLRYGGKATLAGSDAYYRVFGKFKDRDATRLADHTTAPDESQMGQGGFRIDWAASDRDEVTLQGDFYDGDNGFVFEGLEQMDQPPVPRDGRWDVRGADLLARWTRNLSETDGFTFQTYYDRTESGRIGVEAKVDTLDFDFQHRIRWEAHNDLTWGLGYRRTGSHLNNSLTFAFNPNNRVDHLYTGFLQNETHLLDDRLRLTLGTKIERNDYTGWEFQPSARALVVVGEHQSIWASASRALQTGSRVEDVTVTMFQVAATDPGNPFGMQINAEVRGSRDKGVQRVYAFETGYRLMPTDRLSLDLALFYNKYRGLTSIEAPSAYPLWPSSGPPFTAINAQVAISDEETGYSRGAELAAQWQVLDRWRIGAGYTYLRVDLRESSTTGTVEEEQGNYPSQQYNIRSYVDLPAHVQWDTTLYYVGKLEVRNISSYYRLDMRVAWKPIENLELALVGQNLLSHQHAEWDQDYAFIGTEIPRSGYAKVTWSF